MLSSNPIINFFLQIVTLRGSFNWDVVWNNFFASDILHGVVLTVLLSVIAQFIGTLIGLALYFARRSRWRALRILGNTYILLFRGTPLAVQVLGFYVLFQILGYYRTLVPIDPFTPFGFQDVTLGAFLPALIALALNEGAYMAEIIRAGIDSIDVGQLEAARSLGMTYALAMRRIVVPQSLRIIIPPLGNEFNNMLKSSSLATFAGLYELFGTAQHDGARTFNQLEFLFVASIWYLILTSIWSVVQSNIERRLNASSRDQAVGESGSWWQRTFINRGVPTHRDGEAVLPLTH